MYVEKFVKGIGGYFVIKDMNGDRKSKWMDPRLTSQRDPEAVKSNNRKAPGASI